MLERNLENRTSLLSKLKNAFKNRKHGNQQKSRNYLKIPKEIYGRAENLSQINRKIR